MTAGIYIHVPFCLRKCGYCDFYSVKFDEDTAEEYTRAVIRSLKKYDGVTADTVYFGGGTPSLLSAGQFYRILSAIDIADGAEISIECNPVTADAGKFAELRAAGINRLSVGIQSLSDDELKASGRLHSAAQAIETVLSAQAAGFENISADIIMGLPHQTFSSLGTTLNGLTSLPLTHISAYMLTVAEGTPLSRDPVLLKSIADDDTLADMYLLTCGYLREHGFERYEISNFAKPDRECKHNLKYWRCEPYIGIGPAAHSCFGGKRYAVPKDIGKFLANEFQTEEVLDDSPCGAEERLMLALRLKEGAEVSEDIQKNTAPLERAGLVTASGGRISLTDRGCLVSNEIICKISEMAGGDQVAV